MKRVFSAVDEAFFDMRAVDARLDCSTEIVVRTKREKLRRRNSASVVGASLKIQLYQICVCSRILFAYGQFCPRRRSRHRTVSILSVCNPFWDCEVELSKFLTSLHRFRDCARSVVRLLFEFLNDVLVALSVAILIEFERGFKARNRNFETDYAAR